MEEPATLLKVTLLHVLHGCFSNCANSTKSRKTSRMSTKAIINIIND